MRITLVISSLSCGGSERVISLLAEQLSARGHEVTLITIASEDTDFYRLTARAARVSLGMLSKSSNPLSGGLNNLRRCRRLRQALRRARPDAIISFMVETNLLVLLACIRLGVPVIVSERIDPRCYPIDRVREWLRRKLYPAAAAVVVQTQDVKAWMVSQYPHIEVKIIPNFVSRPETDSASAVDLPSAQKIIVGMGRLTWQKGFDVLLQAFARCAATEPEWMLVLIGEGEERGALQRLGERLGVGARLRMVGRQQYPGAILRRASLFVLSSRFEGFPNALLESMACGLPVIATNCRSGPSEIVRSGEDGLLVPPEDVEALAASMRRLMENEKERRRLAERALEVLDRFSMEKVVALWEALLQEVSGAKPARRISEKRRAREDAEPRAHVPDVCA